MKLPGTRNKRTAEFMAVLDNANFCPATELMACYREARAAYGGAEKEQAPMYLGIATEIVKILSSYAYSKPKSLDANKSPILDGLTDQQKLIALKNLIIVLEQDLKENEPDAE